MSTLAFVATIDLYRGILLLEIIILIILYLWAVWKYAFRIRAKDNDMLHGFRIGQASRVGGVIVLLTVFGAAVASRFGSDNNGNLIYNLFLQVAIVLFYNAWIKVDLPRFRAVAATDVAHGILSAMDDHTLELMKEHEATVRGSLKRKP